VAKLKDVPRPDAFGVIGARSEGKKRFALCETAPQEFSCLFCPFAKKQENSEEPPF
jgi:hypothetical protein